MIAACSARPKHVSYTQDSCRRCCAAEGLPGRASYRPEQLQQPSRTLDLLNHLIGPRQE